MHASINEGWCPVSAAMVADSLLNAFNASEIYAQAYADDFTVLSVGSCLATVCRKAHLVLNLSDGWCTRNGLPVNPLKTDVILFTKRRKNTGMLKLSAKRHSHPAIQGS